MNNTTIETNEIKNVSRLVWAPTKIYKGGKMKMDLHVSLDDDCKNGYCDFSITCMIYEKRGSRWMEAGGGCDHESIIKVFPSLKQFCPLHLCDAAGVPLYAVENGMYFMKEDRNKAIDYLRITENECDTLTLALDDKLYFKYLLFSLGIVDRWKKEANIFIQFLEEKTGCKWKNPYKENDSHFKPLTEDETKTVENRISAQYYTIKNIQKRQAAAAVAEYQKKRQDVIDYYTKKEKELRIDMEVKLTVLDFGLSIDNVIYYNHNNKLVFNWCDNTYREWVSEDDFNRFVADVDRSRLPEGIEIELKYKK